MNKHDLPAGATAANDLKSTFKIVERASLMSKAQLLDIVSQPHIDEDDWVAACNELECRGELTLTPVGTTAKCIRPTAGITAFCTACLVVSSIVGALHYFAPKPQVYPVAAPISPPVVTRADVDFGPYMHDLQHRIKVNWHPPKAKDSSRVVVKFKLFRDGHMANLSMLESVAKLEVNNSALEAVTNSNFEPLPPGAPASVDIEFSFDYSVFAKPKAQR